MFDPVSMTLLALGTAASAGGKLFEGFAGSDAGKLQERINLQNADLLRLSAEGERLNIPLVHAKAAVEEGRVRDRLARVLAGDTAHFASGNLDPSYGSPLLLQAFNAAQGETDARLVRASAAVEEARVLGRAQQLEAKASGAAIDAITARQRAESARIAGYFGAGTALLQGAAKWPGLGAGPSAPGAPVLSPSAGFQIGDPYSPAIARTLY